MDPGSPSQGHSVHSLGLETRLHLPQQMAAPHKSSFNSLVRGGGVVWDPCRELSNSHLFCASKG